MFGFTGRSSVRSVSPTVHRAIETDGQQPCVHATPSLLVAESRGSYAGRKVTYIRVFDPERAAAHGLRVQMFEDLDAHPDLVLRAGHIERDGTVVLGRRPHFVAVEMPVRERADRAAHADDEQFVFPAGDQSSRGGQ